MLTEAGPRVVREGAGGVEHTAPLGEVPEGVAHDCLQSLFLWF